MMMRQKIHIFQTKETQNNFGLCCVSACELTIDTSISFIIRLGEESNE